MIAADNPYAAPKADPLVKDVHHDSAISAWRDGRLLVVRKGAELMDQCLKCTAPTEWPRDRFSRNLSWHKPFWILVFLLSPLIYILVFFAVRWQGRVTVGLCPAHRRKRMRAILLGWIAALAGLGLIINTGLLYRTQPIALAAGILLSLFGMIGGIVGSQVLVARRMDRNFIWLDKVSANYLAKLPDWNL
jgi:hypothetical protein